MTSRTKARALEFLANSNGKSSGISYVHIRSYIELRNTYVNNSVCAFCLVFVVIISSLIHYE